MDGVAAPYNCLTPVVLVLHHMQCNKRRTHILLTLYVDVHVLPHALPDGVGGKAGVRASVVPDD